MQLLVGSAQIDYAAGHPSFQQLSFPIYACPAVLRRAAASCARLSPPLSPQASSSHRIAWIQLCWPRKKASHQERTLLALLQPQGIFLRLRAPMQHSLIKAILTQKICRLQWPPCPLPPQSSALTRCIPGLAPQACRDPCTAQHSCGPPR